jgi:hypothetical protein
MGLRRGFAALVLIVAVGAPVALVLRAHAEQGPSPSAAAAARRAGAADPGDAAHQAALVAGEDSRLIQVRAVTAIAPLRGGAQWFQPYRLASGSGYTLVLTERRDPYTVADLLKLAPQTFVRQGDGGYLLTENIYVNTGAKLVLANPGGLVLRLASGPDGFVSLVSFGGGINLAGSAQATVTVTSWDPRTNKPDSDVTDGRAYLRAIGGQFAMTYTKATDLGFWSGRTGGISLTGTDRPDVANITGPAQAASTKNKPQQPGYGDVTALPSGALTTPDGRFGIPSLSYVSGQVSNSTITGNAYGLFISSANGITVLDTTISHSLQDGLVLHRFAVSADIERVVASDNGGTGFHLARATQQVRVSGCAAERNAVDGFLLNGQPLAEGPSASGEPPGAYGGNSVAASVARDNGHYGIEVLGGLTVGIQNNTVTGSDMGIVVRQAASTVTVTGNTVTSSARQGISIRDGVTGAVVTGNVVRDVPVGVYLRDSVAEIRGNTVQQVSNHGISLVGAAGGSKVAYNVVAGVGPAAIETSRAHGPVSVAENQTFAWHDTRTFWLRVRHYASPMTLLWTAIVALILLAAILGRRRDGAPDPARPYAAQQVMGRSVVWDLTAPAPARGRAQVPAAAG